MNVRAPKELPPFCRYCGQKIDEGGYFCSAVCAITLANDLAAHGYSTKTYQDADRRRRLRGDDN